MHATLARTHDVGPDGAGKASHHVHHAAAGKVCVAPPGALGRAAALINHMAHCSPRNPAWERKPPPQTQCTTGGYTSAVMSAEYARYAPNWHRSATAPLTIVAADAANDHWNIQLWNALPWGDTV